MTQMSDTAMAGDGANGDDASQRRAVRRLRKSVQLWDDLQFRHRVQDIVRVRGLVLADVLRAVGAPVDFTYRVADGRNTNIIMRLAKVLEVSPAELAGWEVPRSDEQIEADLPPPPKPTAKASEQILRLVERQNASIFLIALAMVRGDRLGEIAEALGLHEGDVTALLRQQRLTPDEADESKGA